MNPPIKRLLALAGSLVVGLFGAIVLASSAQAHHAVITGTSKCLENGKYEVTWTVTNPQWPSPLMKIINVTSTPAATGFTQIVQNQWLDANEKAIDVQIVDGTATEAKLTVEATWHAVMDGPVKAKPENPASGKVKLGGVCAPVKAEGAATCTTVDVTVTNSEEGETVDAKVTYGTQVVAIDDLAKGTSKKVSLTPSSQNEAVVSFADSDFTVKVSFTKPTNCGGLPQTGSSTTTIMASGAGLAGVGVFVFFMARRRMARLRRLASE